MNKDKLHIIDSLFSHSKVSSWYNESELFEWKRDNYHESNIVVVTNLSDVNKLPDKKIYGWIIEPPEIDNTQYLFAAKNYDKFEKIFTYDYNLLKLSSKFQYIPMGNCWIEKKDRLIYKKTKSVCSIFSHKRMTRLHSLRHEISERYKNIDAFGNGYTPVNNKVDVLKDYMFSVVVENQKMDYFFTEKILDCFLTGTIPIYLGCSNIGDFFDIEGIIQFNDINELQNILRNLNEEVYSKKMNSIEKNLELAKKYVVIDDILYRMIKEGFNIEI